MQVLVLIAAIAGMVLVAVSFYVGVRLGARLQWSSQDGSEPFAKPLKRIEETE